MTAADPSATTPGRADGVRRQEWMTPGLEDTMGRPGVLARMLMSVVASAEMLNRRYARLGNPVVYDNAQFPWVREFEQEWPAIRAELDRVLQRKRELANIQEITPDARSITRDDGWKTLIFLAYGVKSPPNIAMCPETWRALQKIRGLKAAMFSIFEPGKRVPPHRGAYNGVLRLHLGLKIPLPRGATAIRVADRVLTWEEGKAIVFDDAYEHEAWNATTESRVVLFVDFVKPLRFPANLINGLILSLAPFSPYIREGGKNLRKWEGQFHGPTN